MSYSLKKSISKAVPPLILIAIVRAIIGTLESRGITGDDQTVWTISTIAFSAYLALVNWFKNRKRGDDPFKTIKVI